MTDGEWTRQSGARFAILSSHQLQLDRRIHAPAGNKQTFSNKTVVCHTQLKSAIYVDNSF